MTQCNESIALDGTACTCPPRGSASNPECPLARGGIGHVKNCPESGRPCPCLPGSTSEAHCWHNAKTAALPGQSTGRVLRQPTYKPGLAGVYDHELDALEAEIERLRDPRLVHLWTVCPDCGKKGAHHSYTDRGGSSAGVRCG